MVTSGIVNMAFYMLILISTVIFMGQFNLKHNERWMSMFNGGALIDYIFCGCIGFGLRLAQDRKTKPRPDWLFQLAASVALSYLAYFSYLFYKITFTPIELWIMILSWLGAFIFSTGDYIAKNGLLIYARKMAEDFLSFTKKK